MSVITASGRQAYPRFARRQSARLSGCRPRNGPPDHDDRQFVIIVRQPTATDACLPCGVPTALIVMCSGADFEKNQNKTRALRVAAAGGFPSGFQARCFFVADSQLVQ